MTWPFRRNRDADLDDEIRAHLEQAVRDRVERGESVDKARALARQEFGNIAIVKEVTREIWGSSVLYGIRPTDPATFAASAMLLGSLSLLAALVPAIGAGQVDPVVTLRAE